MSRHEIQERMSALKHKMELHVPLTKHEEQELKRLRSEQVAQGYIPLWIPGKPVVLLARSEVHA